MHAILLLLAFLCRGIYEENLKGVLEEEILEGMILVEISEDLKEIVSTTIESIKEGMIGKESGVVGPIEFELAVIKSKGAEGGFRFFLADASGKYSKESISRIKFKVQGITSHRGIATRDLWLTESK